MEIFRNHIMQWAASLFLTLSVAVHAAVPYSGKAQKTAFAQWLDRNVIENGEKSETSIRAHIRQLPVQHENFSLLLEQASVLVADHKNDFRLPLQQHGEDRGGAGLWLVEKWARHQDQTGSMNALLPGAVNPVLKWLVQKNPFAVLSGTAPRPLPAILPHLRVEPVFFIQNTLFPFLSGVSINAP